MLAYLFPGQGSQTRGMGNQLFDEFSELITEANEILGYSIKKLCLEDADKQLNLTQYTQPALYVVNALSYYKKIQESKRKPDYVCGHSLGEYNALLAANVFDFCTGLKLVKKRGELMSRAKNGGMAAIIGLNLHEIETTLKQHSLTTVVIANYNTYTQYVISGPKHDIEQAQQIFGNVSGVNFIPLTVSGAFHSPYMADAEKQFSKFIKNFQFNLPSMPVISNIDAKPYHPANIQENLTKQITHPVKWTSMMEYLLRNDEINMEEIGPGKVLTGLVKQIRSAFLVKTMG